MTQKSDLIAALESALKTANALTKKYLDMVNFDKCDDRQIAELRDIHYQTREALAAMDKAREMLPESRVTNEWLQKRIQNDPDCDIEAGVPLDKNPLLQAPTPQDIRRCNLCGIETNGWGYCSKSKDAKHDVAAMTPQDVATEGQVDDARYGYCPICYGPGISREKRPDGNDRCGNGHEYPSRDAAKGPPRNAYSDDWDETSPHRAKRKVASSEITVVDERELRSKLLDCLIGYKDEEFFRADGSLPTMNKMMDVIRPYLTKTAPVSLKECTPDEVAGKKLWYDHKWWVPEIQATVQPDEATFDAWCASVKDCGYEVQPYSATARQRKLGWDAAMATKRESVTEDDLIYVAKGAITWCPYDQKKQVLMDICRNLLERFDIRRRG